MKIEQFIIEILSVKMSTYPNNCQFNYYVVFISVYISVKVGSCFQMSLILPYKGHWYNALCEIIIKITAALYAVMLSVIKEKTSYC